MAKWIVIGDIHIRDREDLYRDVTALQIVPDMGSKDWFDIKPELITAVKFFKAFPGVLHGSITASDRSNYLTLQMLKSIWMAIMGQGSTTYPTYWKSAARSNTAIPTREYQKWLSANVPSILLEPENLHLLVAQWLSNRRGMEHMVATADLLVHRLREDM